MKKILALAFTILLALASTCMAGAKPIVVLGAMNVEIAQLMNKLEKPKFATTFGHKYATGKIDGYPVVVLQTQMGLTNATSAATLVAERFKPLCVLGIGTAGAHVDNMKIYDIVLQEKICNTNCYDTEPRARGEGSNDEDWNYHDLEIFQNGQWIRTRYVPADAKMLALAQKVAYPYGKVYVGIGNSGDVWNRECDYIDYLHKEMGTICEDMESYGVASVCLKYGIPFLGVRVICNNELVEQTANSVRGGGMDWGEEDFYFNASTHCQNYAYDVIKKIIQEQRKK